MKGHNKSRSMIMVSPHTKNLTLEVTSSKPKFTKPQKTINYSQKNQRKDIILFKLLKNYESPKNNFSSKTIFHSDPFRLPTQTRQRDRKKFSDYNFIETHSNDIGNNVPYHKNTEYFAKIRVVHLCRIKG